MYPYELAEHLKAIGRKVRFAMRNYDNDLNNPYFHDILNCGQHLELREEFIPHARTKFGNRNIIVGYCLKHKIKTCACGWEISKHYGLFEEHKNTKVTAPQAEQDC